MWARAAWREGTREEEGVIPSVWVQDGHVHWPPGANAIAALKEQRIPTKSWTEYPLIKIKFTSGMEGEH